MKFDFITLCDGYKLDHRRQYPKGTTRVYSNWTPRSSRIVGQNEVVFFGLQYFLQSYLSELAEETFFSVNKDKILKNYQRRLNGYFGPNDIGVDHIAALHELKYIPLEFRALPEGSRVPLRVPMFTVENTHDDFFWVTNYLETLMSNILWKPCTSATTAYRFRKMLDRHALKSGDPAFVDWQGHDFSFRGMSGPEDAAMSGAGHLLSFKGTDTLPALDLLEQYYGGYDSALLGMSVPATEHSVMCAGGEKDEKETYSRIINLYPKGIVSIVSDTWDLWHVVGKILPQLKDQIMARDGKTVIRPDSGDPANILCGEGVSEGLNSLRDELISKGLTEALWDIFNGKENDKGYKELDPHIGEIYGDSINYERGDIICERLIEKGFASTTPVFGLGSFTYEYTTRDTYGFAMKATAATIDGVEHQIFKDPKTDNGEKKSAKGRLVVGKGTKQSFEVIDGLTLEQQQELSNTDRLQLVWRNGVFHKRSAVEEIRARLHPVK